MQNGRGATQRRRRQRVDRVEEHTFLPRLLRPSPLVVDLGANHGSFSATMAARYGARCVAVEPNPALAAEIEALGVARVVTKAIGATTGRGRLHVDAGNDRASRLVDADGADSVGIDTVSLDEFLETIDERTIDLVKLDVEGLEVAALLGLSSEHLARIEQLCVEFHDHQSLITLDDMRAVSARLAGEGFLRFQMSRTNLDVLFVRRTLLSRFDRVVVSLLGERVRPAMRLARRRRL